MNACKYSGYCRMYSSNDYTCNKKKSICPIYQNAAKFSTLSGRDQIKFAEEKALDIYFNIKEGKFGSLEFKL